MNKKAHPYRGTAGELMTKLNSDPEFVARAQERDRQLAERSRLAQIEEQPLIEELRTIGVDIKTVWDLVNRPNNYGIAIPTLLRHLQLPYSDVTRGGIARALAMPEAAFTWDTLVEEYSKLPAPTKGQGLGAKNGLAVALSITATDAVINELCRLAKDRSHGESRGLLLGALRKSKNPVAKQTLEELTSDDQLEKEIKSWKLRRRPQRQRLNG